MFSFDRVKETVLKNKYILYLDKIGIETETIINSIKTRIEKDGKTLDNVFSNSIYKMLSPNVLIENIIFEETNKYLYKNFKDSVIFDDEVSLDLKSIIASKNSLIDRPNIKKPSDVDEGFICEFTIENNYIRIARFESEIIMDSHQFERKGQSILFEGIIPTPVKINPFINNEPSINIWNNIFHEDEPYNIIGFCTSFNSIESCDILWLNSYFIKEFKLKLSTFNDGLQALNEDGEIILEFRQWRKDLIGNGASFVGTDSNIAKLEGCDLLLREDYFKELNQFFPDLVIRTEKLGY